MRGTSDTYLRNAGCSLRGPLKYYRHGDDVETPRAFKKENQILSLSLLTVQPFNTQNHLPLKNIFSDKYNSEELKGEVYKALILPTSLYSCEAWSLREDLFKRLRSFHNRCARSICRVNLHHTFRHHITSSSLFRRLGILDIGSYFHNRIVRWAGHVARMPMSRAPRQLLTSWVSLSRPIGCPQMTLGRTLENALKSKGISKEFDECIAIAKDRSKWRQLTHSIHKPPDA